MISKINFHSINSYSKKRFFHYITFFHPIKLFLLLHELSNIQSSDHIWSSIFIFRGGVEGQELQ